MISHFNVSLINVQSYLSEFVQQEDAIIERKIVFIFREIHYSAVYSTIHFSRRKGKNKQISFIETILISYETSRNARFLFSAEMIIHRVELLNVLMISLSGVHLWSLIGLHTILLSSQFDFASNFE